MNSDESSLTLSPIDWLMPWTYIRQIYCFPSTHADSAQVLKTGLLKTARDIPHITGAVVGPASSTKVTAWISSHQEAEDVLFAEQDKSSDLSYAALKASGAVANV